MSNQDIDHFINTDGHDEEREKLIGKHIGYRYDVNLVPDYNRLTSFPEKYIDVIGWPILTGSKMFIWGVRKVGPQFLIEILMAGLVFRKI